MNIFYLDENPQLAAQYHCDKHVVKMILESAQLLCTAVNVKAGEQVTPYKTTHVNHPCSVWVRESYSNWKFVYCLMEALEEEWQYRYKHIKFHKSTTVLQEAGIIDLAWRYLKPTGIAKFTTPALAMPDHCKISTNPVECYREYYRKEKIALHKWTGRNVPEWL